MVDIVILFTRKDIYAIMKIIVADYAIQQVAKRFGLKVMEEIKNRESIEMFLERKAEEALSRIKDIKIFKGLKNFNITKERITYVF